MKDDLQVPPTWLDPPRGYSVMPFWFWNDALSAEELVRQIQDFEAHGVYGFVIHPRVGLPRDLGWMSERLLQFYAVAIEEARRRGMGVVLYDEGMYPSGSSSGQVVAANPDYQCRCLAKRDLAGGEEPVVGAGEHLVAVVRRRNGSRMAVIDRKADSFIRGLHYVGEGPAEDEPAAADLLNPDAVATFIQLVYDGFARHFAPYFGTTVLAMFTDEPALLGRSRERGIVPGTTGILTELNRILGYDFTPHLPALWDADEPAAAHYRAEYERAILQRLEETYYAQLYDWCDRHGLALTGHPARGDEIGPLRYFHVPGQDLVWRWVLPDHPSALEGPESTQGKCSSSAMLHHGRRRNANECCGAYGHELTWDEMAWLAQWCFVRGVNWLFPHAFYYSVRGLRRDERPPDVGPNAPWWDRYRTYADMCRRLSRLNAEGRHICQTAILTKSSGLPWQSAKVCFEHQVDFNYLEERHLWEDAVVASDGVRLRGMHYTTVIVGETPDPRAEPFLKLLDDGGRLLRYGATLSEIDFAQALASRGLAAIRATPAPPGLRVRHLVLDQLHAFLLFNETQPDIDTRIELPVVGELLVLDPLSGAVASVSGPPHIFLRGHTSVILIARPANPEAESH